MDIQRRTNPVKYLVNLPIIPDIRFDEFYLRTKNSTKRFIIEDVKRKNILIS